MCMLAKYGSGTSTPMLLHRFAKRTFQLWLSAGLACDALIAASMVFLVSTDILYVAIGP